MTDINEMSFTEKQRELAGEVVYFLASGQFVKIGYSANIAQRLYRFLCDTPDPKLLHIERGTRDDEWELHKKFGHLRYRGEWFRAGDEIYEHIKARRKENGQPDFVSPDEVVAR